MILTPGRAARLALGRFPHTSEPERQFAESDACDQGGRRDEVIRSRAHRAGRRRSVASIWPRRIVVTGESGMMKSGWDKGAPRRAAMGPWDAIGRVRRSRPGGRRDEVGFGQELAGRAPWVCGMQLDVSNSRDGGERRDEVGFGREYSERVATGRRQPTGRADAPHRGRAVSRSRVRTGVLRAGHHGSAATHRPSRRSSQGEGGVTESGRTRAHRVGRHGSTGSNWPCEHPRRGGVE